MQDHQNEKYTVLYARLSDEDKRNGTSLSIEHQEAMLRACAQKLGLDHIVFLQDDGITGTKAKRADFETVMQMVWAGQVGTLIVTDLSRLYRNQAEANNLMEIVFPSLGIRFIAITDHYDSATNTSSEEDLAMFLNLFNEYYPRQVSRKVNAVITMKAEKGVRVASIPPYGYQKDPQDKLKIVPDPEAAEMVQYIFKLCASGLGPAQIASRLKQEHALVPAEYAYRKFGRDHATRNPDRPYEWSDGTVARILECEDYIGVQVSCRSHKVSYKSDVVLPVPPEKQYRVENAHEPIIPRELWDVVQERRSHKRRPTKMGEMDMLSGMVYCADCGHVHHLCRCGHWDESKYTYVCGTYHGHKDECTPHTIKALHLRKLVLAAIRAVCKMVETDREAFVAYVLSKRSQQARAELVENRRELERAEKRLTELDALLTAAFEKLAAGVLSDQQFTQLSERYEEERSGLQAHIPVLEDSLSKGQEQMENADKFLKIVDRYLDIQELTPEILREFIHHVVVHERSEPSKKKYYTQNVDIFFHYIGRLDLDGNKE